MKILCAILFGIACAIILYYYSVTIVFKIKSILKFFKKRG